MPKQRTELGEVNGCWAPPVVAMSRFYGFARPASSGEADGGVVNDSEVCNHIVGGPAPPEMSVASVLALRPNDKPEGAYEVFKDEILPEVVRGLVTATVFSDDAEVERDLSDTSVVFGGSTSEMDFGTRRAATSWFTDVQSTIDRGDVILLLVERLDGGKDKGNTHYLLGVGYEESSSRRGGTAYTLYVKDPMEGDVVLAAPLWHEPTIELCTRQINGAVLDRYAVLESTHLRLAEHRRDTTSEKPPL